MYAKKYSVAFTTPLVPFAVKKTNNIIEYENSRKL
jgi:hypothetical protein